MDNQQDLCHIDYINSLIDEAATWGIKIEQPVQRPNGLWQCTSSWGEEGNRSEHLGKPMRTAREAIQDIFNELIVVGKIIGKHRHDN